MLATDGKRRFNSHVFAADHDLVAFAARCQIGRGACTFAITRDPAASGSGIVKPQRQTRIFLRQHNRPLGRQCHDRKSVFAGRGLDAVQKFLMLALRIGNHRYRRSNPAHKLGHFSRVADPRFDHGNLRFTIKPQQHHRYADVVVVIFFCCHNARFTDKRTQNRSDHLRGGGFSVAAGNANHRHGKLAAPGSRQGAQCLLSITHNNLRATCPRVALDNHDACAVSRRLRRIVMSVEALALERNKNAPLSHLSRIGAHRTQISPRGVAERAHNDSCERMLERAHCPSVLSNHLRLQFFCARRVYRSLKASRAVSKSSKGCRTPAIS